MNTEQLINRVLNHGDQGAYAELVQQHQSALRYSIRQWTGWDIALADDIAQETFIRAYRKLHLFEQKAKFSTWLYRIAYTTWLNARKKHNVGTSISGKTPEHSHRGHEQQVVAAHDLENALAQLPEGQRLAIHLCLQRGFTHAEASNILNLPIGTVKTHVNRGRNTLRILMTDYDNRSCPEVYESE